MSILAGAGVPADLATHVAGTFVFRTGAQAEERSPVDDCTNLVVQLGARPVAFVCGPEPTYRPIVGATEQLFVGIRLRPGAVAELFGVPGRDMAGRMRRLEDLVAGREHRSFIERAEGAAETFDAVFDLLRRRPRPRRRAATDRVRLATALLSAPSPATLHGVLRELQTSERTLRRDFVSTIGLGPKLFARILRFRRAAAELAVSSSLAALAADHGYADHAHMTREFVAFAGLTPSELLRTPRPFPFMPSQVLR